MRSSIDGGNLGGGLGNGLLIAILFTLVATSTSAHETYRKALDRMAGELRERIQEHHAEKILVGQMRRVDGLDCEIGNTITLDLEAALANGRRSFRLLDRQHMEAMETEHRLELEGMMDPEQRMREAGRLLKADVMIFGSYTYTGDLLVLRTKAVDIQTSEQLVILAATSRPDAVITSLCFPSAREPAIFDAAPDIWGGTRAEAPAFITASNGGAPDLADCLIREFGAFCFKNTSSKDIEIRTGFPKALGGSMPASLLVLSGRTECFFGKPVGSYEYTIHTLWEADDHSHPAAHAIPSSEGLLRVDPCVVGQVVVR